MRKILALSFFAVALVFSATAKADTLYQYDVQQIYVGQNTCNGRPCTQSLDVTFFVDIVHAGPDEIGTWRVDIPASSFVLNTFGDLCSGIFGAPNVTQDGTVRYVYAAGNYIALNIFGSEFDLRMNFLSPYVPTETTPINFGGEIWSCAAGDCANDFGNGQAWAGYHYDPAYSSTKYKIISTPESTSLLLLVTGLVSMLLGRKKLFGA